MLNAKRGVATPAMGLASTASSKRERLRGLGALKGRKVRTNKLTLAQRKRIGSKAAAVRWKKSADFWTCRGHTHCLNYGFSCWPASVRFLFMAIETPIGIALIVCDQIIQDIATGKRSLIGVFNLVYSAAFPFTLHKLCVLASNYTD